MLEKKIFGFNWAMRTAQPVVDLFFEEGLYSEQKLSATKQWLRLHSDKYKNEYVRLYHATAKAAPILKEGLKPTSASRRRSYQSTSGYVYLAATAARAKAFGDLGNGGSSVVYEVLVPIRRLKADIDQLSNHRIAGALVGNSLAESIAYAGTVRVKGSIEPWAIQLIE